MKTFGEWVALVLAVGIDNVTEVCPIQEAEETLDDLECQEELRREFDIQEVA